MQRKTLATTAVAPFGVALALALALATPAVAQMSALDVTNAAASSQNQDLSPHRTPPTPAALDALPVDRLKLPAGFKAEVWSHGHAAGRTMVMGDKGTVFVGTRQLGRVYAITDQGGERTVRVIAEGLVQPNGLAFRDGSLYVLAINEVFRYDGIEDNLDAPGEPVALTEAFGLPPEVHHNWKYADFGPDGRLYVQVGADCNICEVNPGVHAQIRAYEPDGSNMEIVARGVRNTVGFDWHPATGELWFSDNGRDWAGDDGPQDEFNRLPANLYGASFGFPYCHSDGVPDPDIRRPNPCAGVIMPAALLGPHAGALGVRFYDGDMFPVAYRNVAFVARRGSWNREDKFGYDVVAVTTHPDGSATVQPFMTGLLDEAANDFVGRPTYILQMPDGALLVSDETNGAIYRISYDAG
ncbi:PQQ-dependent sugar dehydrogenase [Rubrimonas cliftonensis]|uniref:Glucose/arabinose dehydrogenase, beta-propeller fold n=1 Tax=Rubrimonas cliftonensis TaxID=89524 RepID=A0A1H3WY20_9RHOB|nr:PQQ-dependent sugar dehydrogenase [Rubrimonas cliftonensis]SDZ92009.1 Glucose/arabinose dehydrogenase, beta-propeller fold [Rubrimonas cliftonensis]